MAKSAEKDPYRALYTFKCRDGYSFTESVKKKTSDKILRRFNLAEIIFKEKKKMKNIAHKK